jgi:hypothetical protein
VRRDHSATWYSENDRPLAAYLHECLGQFSTGLGPITEARHHRSTTVVRSLMGGQASAEMKRPDVNAPGSSRRLRRCGCPLGAFARGPLLGRVHQLLQ